MGDIKQKELLPIGVFDSGLGGISVLRELVKIMPNENFIFFGDSKNAPYGTKTLEEVRKLSLADADFLYQQGIKALVVACNTVTSAAVHILRETYKDIPVIGIEPALKPAVLSKEHPTVAVMATPMTIREKKFHDLMMCYRKQAEIIPIPCPGLVEFVERGELEGEEIEAFLKEIFAPYAEQKIDAVVLGCTHYPLVRHTIQKVLGPEVMLFDGGEGTARETKRKLKEYGISNPGEEKGRVVFKNSLEEKQVLELSEMLFGNYDGN